MEQWTPSMDSDSHLSTSDINDLKPKDLILKLQGFWYSTSMNSVYNKQELKLMFQKYTAPKPVEVTDKEIQKFKELDTILCKCNACYRYFTIRNDINSITKLILGYSKLRVQMPGMNEQLQSRSGDTQLTKEQVVQCRKILALNLKLVGSLILKCPDCLLREFSDIYQLILENDGIKMAMNRKELDDAFLLTKTLYRTFLFLMYVSAMD